jgi:H+/Cl- antiporter ClcA
MKSRRTSFRPIPRIRRTVLEQSALFFSVLRWSILATLVGAITGTSTWAFVSLLEWSAGKTSTWPYWFLLAPIGMILSALSIRLLAPDAEGHGTEKVIEAVHRFSGRISLKIAPVKTLATVITIASGGSAGKEGPAAQIGGSLASGIANLLRLSADDRRKLVVCGISAGFASVFGTPIAGALFGIEVLFLGNILYEVLVPSFVAGITAYQVSHWLGLTYFAQPIVFVPTFTEGFFFKIILTGVAFGLVTVLLIEIFRYVHRNMRLLIPNFLVRALAGGSVLVFLGLIFGKQVLGLGMIEIGTALSGNHVPPLNWLGKILAVAVTLGCGGSGGVVTPIFFVGASFGNFWASVIGADPMTIAAIGLTAVLAGAANTPIAASMLVIEMFGPAIGPYAAMCAVVSFLMSGHRSVYPSQVLAASKSETLRARLQRPLGAGESRVSDAAFRDVEQALSLPKAIWRFVTSGEWRWHK